VYHAAVLYYPRTVSAPGEKLPRFDQETEQEVRPIFNVRWACGFVRARGSAP
jgi:hypothetical protein